MWWCLLCAYLVSQDIFITLQAFWRGHCLRQRIKDKKVLEVRKKVQEATRNVKEENKLYYRTSQAIDFLLSYRQLSHVLEALINLGLWYLQSVNCVFITHADYVGRRG